LADANIVRAEIADLMKDLFCWISLLTEPTAHRKKINNWKRSIRNRQPSVLCHLDADEKVLGTSAIPKSTAEFAAFEIGTNTNKQRHFDEIILALLLAAATLAAQEPIRGFPQSAWATEHELEQKAGAIPQASRQKVIWSVWPRFRITPVRPRRLRAEYALGLFKEFGLEAHIEQF